MNFNLINQRFNILQKLSEGGFGQTFIVEDIKNLVKPKYVVKKLRPQPGNREVFNVAHRLFEQETKVLYHLGKHEQIPTLIQDFEENGEFYLVQEYIEGKTLQQEIDEGKVFSQNEVVDLLIQLLRILSYVHSENVIHRDIKPSNIIRRKSDGKLVLIDFGAVKQVRSKISVDENGYTTATVAIGSNGYMATEQLAGHPKYSSDIYSAGMLAIQLLTGTHPMKLQQSQQTGEWIWSENIAINKELEKIIKQMVFYDFRQRYDLAILVINELIKLKSKNLIPDNKPALSGALPNANTSFNQTQYVQPISNNLQNNTNTSNNNFVSANTVFEENNRQADLSENPNNNSINHYPKTAKSNTKNNIYKESTISHGKVAVISMLVFVSSLIGLMVYGVNSFVKDQTNTVKKEKTISEIEHIEYSKEQMRKIQAKIIEQNKPKPLSYDPKETKINQPMVRSSKTRITPTISRTRKNATYQTPKLYDPFDEALNRKAKAIELEQNMSNEREILDARSQWLSASSSFSMVKSNDVNYSKAQQEKKYCDQKVKYLLKVYQENSKRIRQEKKEKEKRESVERYLNTGN